MKKWVKLTIFLSCHSYGQILLDPPAVRMKPPQDDRLYEEKKIEKPYESKKNKELETKQDFEKTKKNFKNPDLGFFSGIVSTSKNTFIKNYQFGTFFSTFKLKNNFFYGLRLIEFSGNQNLLKEKKNIPMRYSDIRYGPVFGFGKINQKEDIYHIDPKKALSIDDRVKKSMFLFSQTGWMLTSGFSLSSKRRFFDPIHSELKENVGGVRISIFCEFSYMQFLVQNFSVNYFFGIEKGPEEYHSWIGISLGFWF